MTSPEPVLVRPQRLRRVCWGLAVSVVALFTVVAIGLGGGPPGELQFQRADQAAFIGLSLLIAGGLLVFTRARVEADASAVRVRNALGTKVLPWAVVREIRFDDGSPWASLELQDDDAHALFAVQANDGARAQEAVQRMRALLEASRARRSDGAQGDGPGGADA